MSSRLIAAAVLASLFGWSVPLAQAWSGPEMARTGIASSASSAHDHSCCPGVNSQFVRPIFVNFAPASMPCGDDHPCCAQHGPDNPASLPAVTRIPRFDSQASPVALPGKGSRDHAKTLAATLGSDPLQAYSLRSTVLRI